jgi:DNA primase large subunit
MAESKLFAWRLGLSQTNEVFKILSLQGLKYDAWNEEETKSFKVRFEEVPCLVSYRKTVICGGFCKVSMQDMAYVVLHHFEQQLHKYLRLLARTIPFIWQEFIRIEPIVIRIMRRYKNISQVIHKNMNSCVTPSEIDSIYKERFPLCMQYLHEKLRENHHLKYEGRVQYRMFLKGIGFTVEQNILFWQQEFTKSMSVQKFEKEYLYNIRHSYGLEGARKDYEPLTCSQILTNAAPRVGQYHGCPFKHWDPETLRHFLCKRGHSTVNANEIAHFSRQAKPQLACQKYFEFLHPLKDSKHIGEHPNAWFHSVQE